MTSRRLSPHVSAGVLVFAISFSLFGLTTSELGGYEPETAAVTEGFVKTGSFRLLEESPLRSEGRRGRNGHLYGRVGLPQPLLEAPFYVVGDAIDAAVSDGEEYTYRKLGLWLYNPFVMALAAAGVFGLVLLRRGSTRWAAAIALLFTCASLAWPYSKIGMEATLTFAVVWLLFFAALAARNERYWPWIGVGCFAGMAFAAKTYSLLVLLPAAAMLWPALRAASPRRRRLLGLAAAAPFASWVAAVLAYNLARFGTVLESEESYDATITLPVNFLGFFVSPGKGLLLYSPLVILGLLGLRELRRTDRNLAIAIVGCVVIGAVVVAGSNHWSDETWGPRYLVAEAWLLLVPIAWWANTRRRRTALAAVAVVAVAVQAVAVLAPYQTYARSYPKLTGVRFLHEQRREVTDAPFGRDPLRWVPQLSPLVVQGAVVSSWAKEELGGGAIRLRYTPYEGRRNELDLTGGAAAIGVRLPDLWWTIPHSADNPQPSRWIAAALLGVLLASFAAMAKLWRRLRLTDDLYEAGASAATAGDGAPELDAVVREQLPWPDRLLVGPSLRRLRAELEPNEKVLRLGAATYGREVCAIAATDRALLITSGHRRRRLHFGAIDELRADENVPGGRLVIVCEGEQLELDLIGAPERAAELAAARNGGAPSPDES